MGRMQTRVIAYVPGIALCVGIAIVAYALGRVVPLVGGPVFGILLGVAVAAMRKPSAPFAAGIKFSSKFVLQLSIVLFGATLNLAQIVRSGGSSLAVMLGTLVITLFAAYVLGRLLRIERVLRALIGVGTAICGASAIAATSGVIGAEEPYIAYAISTVFLFNIVAVLTFPPLGHLMHLSQAAFGLWAGTAINDTSSVVAAGFAYGPVAATEAVIVKLTRTTLIIPIVLALWALRVVRDRRAGTAVQWRTVIPWFILWFIVAAGLNTASLIPLAWHATITAIAVFCIVIALSGVGLSVDFQKMRAAGAAPLLLGFLLWVIIAASSLLIARLV